MKTRSTFALCYLPVVLAALVCSAAQADTILAVDSGTYNVSTNTSPEYANLFTFPEPFTLTSMLVHGNIAGNPQAPPPPGDVTLFLWADSSGSPGAVLWQDNVTLSNNGSGWDQYVVPPTVFATGDTLFAGLQLGEGGYAPYDNALTSAGKSYYFNGDKWQLGAPSGIPGNLMVELEGSASGSGSGGTPEPASVLLIGASCGMFGFLRRRKTRR